MAKTKTKAAPAAEAPPVPPAPARVTRKQALIDLLRSSEGATAAELGAAVGWQVHSVRGFIAGTLKKQADISVLSERKDGVTRYRVVDAAGASA